MTLGGYKIFVPEIISLGDARRLTTVSLQQPDCTLSQHFAPLKVQTWSELSKVCQLTGEAVCSDPTCGTYY